MQNPFFKKTKNIKINDILSKLDIKKQKKNYFVNDVKELETASVKDISFFHSLKYLNSLKKTKSKLILTNKKFINFIPKNIEIIEVSNVNLAVSKITSLFYPNALEDIFDIEVKPIDKKKYFHLKSGYNVLVGTNVKI